MAGQYFLRLLRYLRSVLLQDAAVLIEKYPHNPAFQHPIFSSELFIQFAADLRRSVSATPSVPTVSLNSAENLVELKDAMSSSFASFLASQDGWRRELHSRFDTLHVAIEDGKKERRSNQVCYIFTYT